MDTMQTRSPIRSHTAAVLAAVVLATFLAGCGDDAPPAQEAEQAAPSTPGVLRVTLESLPDQFAEGLAVLTRSGDQVTAEVELASSLGPGDYAVHIHEGTCEEGGRVAVSLTSINGGESGSGHASTTFAASELPATGDYFVQIHRPGGTPIACGDLPPRDNF